MIFFLCIIKELKTLNLLVMTKSFIYNRMFKVFCGIWHVVSLWDKFFFMFLKHTYCTYIYTYIGTCRHTHICIHLHIKKCMKRLQQKPSSYVFLVFNNYSTPHILTLCVLVAFLARCVLEHLGLVA